MKKYLIISITFLLILVSCNNENKKKENNHKDNNPVKIGVILPLTGNAAIYGKAMKNGIELAKNDSKT